MRVQCTGVIQQNRVLRYIIAIPTCVCVYVDYERIALITIPTPSLCEETASKARAWAVCT